MLSAKCHPYCSGLNDLMHWILQESQMARLEAQMSRYQRAAANQPNSHKLSFIQASQTVHHQSTPEGSPASQRRLRKFLEESKTNNNITEDWRMAGRTLEDTTLMFSEDSTILNMDSGNQDLAREELDFLGVKSLDGTIESSAGEISSVYSNARLDADSIFSSTLPEVRLNNQVTARQQDHLIPVLRNQTSEEASDHSGHESGLHDLGGDTLEEDGQSETEEIIHQMSLQQRSVDTEALVTMETETQLYACLEEDPDSLLGMWQQIRAQESQKSGQKDLSSHPPETYSNKNNNRDSTLDNTTRIPVPNQSRKKSASNVSTKSTLRAGTISSVNKNTKKVAGKPEVKKQPVPGIGASKPKQSTGAAKSKPSQMPKAKVTNSLRSKVGSPDFATRKSVQSQYELIFGMESSGQGHPEVSHVSSSSGASSSPEQSFGIPSTGGGKCGNWTWH